MRKIRSGILGITSNTGQFLIKLLESHPFITLTELADSERFSGKKLKDLDIWNISETVPPYVRSLTITGSAPNHQCDIIFSCMDSPGGEIENKFADYNYPVIMQSDALALDKFIPIIVPEVNQSHSKLIKIQKKEKFRKKGFIISNADIITFCTSILAKPFIDRYGLCKINITYADNPDRDPSYDPDHNEIETRLKKVLGEFKSTDISPADIEITFDEYSGHIPEHGNIILTFEFFNAVNDLKPDTLFNLIKSRSLNPSKYSVPENIINYPGEGLKEYLTKDNYFSLLSYDLANEQKLRLEINVENSSFLSAKAMIILAEFMYYERFI